MVIDRRTFTLSLIATALSGPVVWHAVASPRTMFITSARDRLDGRFKAIGLDHKFHVVWQETLPDRAHAAVVHPHAGTVVMIGRRPGHFAEIRSTINGALRHHIAAVPERHFYGHGAFDPTGRYLFLTENNFDSGAGVIGIYDALDHYNRLDEILSGGIGPHEIALMPNGRSLVVANGGIRTHPDRGRDKLNLDTMTPSVQFIDIATGTLEQAFTFPHLSLNQLSIRHLATLADGRVVVGCQDQALARPKHDLVYVSDGDAGTLCPLTTPGNVLARMKGYVGSMAISADKKTIAASCPRGNTVVFWDAQTLDIMGQTKLNDVCGLAGITNSGQIIATNGEGMIFQIHQTATRQNNARHSFLQWDNHITAAPI